MEQKYIAADESYAGLTEYIQENNLKKILLVCGNSLRSLRISAYFKKLEMEFGVKVSYFSDFSPNPLYESVAEGVRQFHKEKCDSIIAVGGGSAMDVAKCIKLYSNMKPDENYLQQTIVPNQIKFIAIPTTAGTGSEATRFAVIYYKGEKQSVSDCSCIPDAVLLDPSVLTTLPAYQKKATMMDALCHAIEAYWSINSTIESREYSTEAIKRILTSMDRYLANEQSGNAQMLQAANIAGKAINITQTTAGHAMCYKLTTLYGITHGHAAALCVRELWPYMLEHIDNCVDPRGGEYLIRAFMELAKTMGGSSSKEGADEFRKIFDKLELYIPKSIENDFEVLKTSVNPVRLKNNPVRLDIDAIDMLYHRILRGDDEE